MKDIHSPTSHNNQAYEDANEAAFEAAHTDYYGDFIEYDDYSDYDEAYAYESHDSHQDNDYHYDDMYEEEYDTYTEEHYDNHAGNDIYDDVVLYDAPYIPEEERLPEEPRWTRRRFIYLIIAIVIIMGLILLFVLPLVTQIISPPAPTPIQPGSML